MRLVLLVHLATLTKVDGQLLFVVQGFSCHECLGTVGVGNSTPGWEIIQQLDCVEGEMNCH